MLCTSYGKQNADYQLGMGFFVQKKIKSAVKKVEVSNGTTYAALSLCLRDNIFSEYACTN
jgi:hypothetical protein